jgi:hypothetical protein
MLNEGSATSPPSLPSSPQARQSFPPPASPQRTQMLSFRRSRLGFIYFGTAMALLCAFVMFYFLFRQDHPSAPPTRAMTGPVAAPAPAQASVSNVPAPVASPPKEVPKQQEPPPEPVQFRIKRSKSFEKVGPIRLRLVKANLKWSTCDLYVNAGGSSYQKQAHLNRPVQIELPDSAGSAELVVTGIRADQISGSVQQKQ